MNIQNKPNKSKEEAEQAQADIIQNQPEIEALKLQIEDLSNQLKEANFKHIRTLADYQNMAKRVEKEKQDWVKYSNENLIIKILDISDNLDRAAGFIKDQGLELVRSSLRQLLNEFGVTEIDILGKDFDPHLMECLDKISGEKGKVVDVKLKGYMLHDKVLRPAKVVVGE